MPKPSGSAIAIAKRMYALEGAMEEAALDKRMVRRRTQPVEQLIHGLGKFRKWSARMKELGTSVRMPLPADISLVEKRCGAYPGAKRIGALPICRSAARNDHSAGVSCEQRSPYTVPSALVSAMPAAAASGSR